MSSPKIDPYSLRHTKDILSAIEAYERELAASSDRPKAMAAALSQYEAVSGRRGNERTVRRWLRVIVSYGGVAKTPENAFGGRNDCAKAYRPTRDQMQAILGQVDRLMRRISESRASSERKVQALAEIATFMCDLLSHIVDDPARTHLAVIKAVVTRLKSVPVHQLYRYVRSSEIESTLANALKGLRRITQDEEESPTA